MPWRYVTYGAEFKETLRQTGGRAGTDQGTERTFDGQDGIKFQSSVKAKVLCCHVSLFSVRVQSPVFRRGTV